MAAPEMSTSATRWNTTTSPRHGRLERLGENRWRWVEFYPLKMPVPSRDSHQTLDDYYRGDLGWRR